MDQSVPRVLIVEDEKPLAQVLKTKLLKSGFHADAVNNGQEAIESVRSNQYDLILLDLMMPKMDGFAVLGNFKSMQLQTPVIVTSNLNQQEDLQRAKDLGASGYFVKSDTSLAQIVNFIEERFKIASQPDSASTSQPTNPESS